MTSAFASPLPGTRSGRMAFPPPIPRGVPSPGGADAAEQADRLIRAVRDMYIQWRGAHSSDIPPETLAANSGAFADSEAIKAIGPAVDAVKQSSDAAAKQVAAILKGLTVEPTADAQATATRYFARVQRTLGNLTGGRLVAAAQQVIADATPEQIPVLVEDLIPLLASKDIPAERLTGSLSAKVPGLADAATEATRTAKQHSIIRANADSLTRAAQKDTDPRPLVDVALADNTAPYADGYST